MKKLVLSLGLLFALLGSVPVFAADCCGCCKDKCECKCCQK